MGLSLSLANDTTDNEGSIHKTTLIVPTNSTENAYRANEMRYELYHLLRASHVDSIRHHNTQPVSDRYTIYSVVMSGFRKELV